MFREKCLVCGSIGLEPIIDLGSHPFADTFVPAERLAAADKVYPLVVNLCPKCFMFQLKTETTPEERYGETAYSYTSSNSKFSRDHWDSFAEEVIEKVRLQKTHKVLEVGSNDGYLLKNFQKYAFISHGVDISEEMCEIARKQDLVTMQWSFGTEFASMLKTLHTYDLIVANNVLNHANDPLDFAKAVARLLSKNGTFVFESPYWLDGIDNERFDQIYHEHVTYLTATNVVNLFNEVGLTVNHIDRVDYHGGSLRGYVSFNRRQDESVTAMIEKEKVYHYPDFYVNWMRAIRDRRSRFLWAFYKTLSQGEKFVAVGAAAKGNTLLNYYNLDRTSIACVTDASPHKIGKFTPKTRIPIVDDSTLAGMGKVNAIILSWNISKQLKASLLKINPEINFIET